MSSKKDHEEMLDWANIVANPERKNGHRFTYKYEMVTIGDFHKDMAKALLYFAKRRKACSGLAGEVEIIPSSPVESVIEHCCSNSIAPRVCVSGNVEWERITIRYGNGSERVVWQGPKWQADQAGEER